MKRWILGAATLAACLSAQAALLTGAQANEVCVPSLKGGFEFSVTGNWMRAFYQQSYFAIVDTQATTGQPIGELACVDFDHEFGYGLMVGWDFCDTGNDVRISWNRFCNDDDNSAEKGAGELWTTYGQIDDDFIEFAERAHAKIEIDTDDLNLEVGQHVSIGCHGDLRLFAGVSYADVCKTMAVHYIGDTAAAEDSGLLEDINIDSEFEGYGPRVGFDFSYAFCGGFGFVTHFGAGLYYGCLDSKFHMIEHEAEDVVNVEAKDKDHLVPMVDLRLALDYSYVFCNQSVLTVEAGYWSKHYFDAVSYIDLTGENDTGGVKSFDNHVFTQGENVGYGGWYVTLNYAL